MIPRGRQDRRPASADDSVDGVAVAALGIRSVNRWLPGAGQRSVGIRCGMSTPTSPGSAERPTPDLEDAFGEDAVGEDAIDEDAPAERQDSRT